MIQVLEKLQESGIKFSLKGGGVSVNVNDYDSINLAIVALAKKAKDKYPESDFAKYYKRRLKRWERDR